MTHEERVETDKREMEKLKVLEPQNVRDEIKNSIKKMLEHYA